MKKSKKRLTNIFFAEMTNVFLTSGVLKYLPLIRQCCSRNPTAGVVLWTMQISARNAGRSNIHQSGTFTSLRKPSLDVGCDGRVTWSSLIIALEACLASESACRRGGSGLKVKKR